MSPLSSRIREYRERAGLSQAELGKLAGLRQATLSDIESGKVSDVRLSTVEKLATALGVKPQELIQSQARRRR